jgi:hypothetical protein
MNWIKQNTFLAGLLAVLVIGVAASGLFFMKARGKYTEATEQLSKAFTAKAALEAEQPFPNSANADVVRGLVTNFRTKAEALTAKMISAQAEMPSGVKVARFQENLSDQVSAVVSAAESAGVVLPEGFYLGLDKYRAQVPLDQAVDRLQFQLDATVRLTDVLFANDVGKFSIKRDQMEFELRAAAPVKPRAGKPARAAKGVPDEPVSEVFPMELAVEMAPRGFQGLLNDLSNTAVTLGVENAVDGEPVGEYYFVTRWLRVENEIPTGPERARIDDDPADADADAENGEAAAKPDLNMVFGAEKVRAYLALDLVRFLKAEPAN